MMFPFPKIDNNMILIVSVFIIIYVLTLETTSKSLNNIDKINVVKPNIIENPYAVSKQKVFGDKFTQQCKGMNLPPGSYCEEDEHFTQKTSCPTLNDMINDTNNINKKLSEKSRNETIPFPKDQGPSAPLSYIGKQENDDWFNEKQYNTQIQIIEDPSRQMRSTQGNIVPGGGDYRSVPSVTNDPAAAGMLFSIGTQGFNVEMTPTPSV